MMTRAALAAIDGYQRWISPYKGFRCAYSVAHGGPGCSGYAKAVIRDEGLWRAWQLMRVRFAACKAAAVALSQARETDAAKEQRARKRDQFCDGLECCASSPRLCYGVGDCATGGVDGGTKGCDCLPCGGCSW